MIINNYDLDNFVGGHLTRLSTVDDIRLQRIHIGLECDSQESYIAKVVGPANPGNSWATTNTYLETMTQ